MLFREACCDLKPARELARLLIRAVVQDGHDPTDPDVIQPELEPAEFASTAMQLLGWPHDFVRPDYRAQFVRVQQQLADARTNRPDDDAEWKSGAGAALAAFLTQGVVPAEPRYFAWVIATSEQFAIHSDYFGRGNKALLAAFDALASESEADRAQALQQVGPLQVQATAAMKR